MEDTMEREDEMSTQHTSGPWRVGQSAVYRTVMARDDSLICFVALKENDRINAGLIAAAPDLYEALVQAVTESGFSVAGPTDSRAAENGEPKWVCQARAAIAKTKGES